jgi:predicted dehydrogenase
MRIGFLGTGSMGLSHVQLIRDEFPRVELSAVLDRFEPNVEKVREAAPAAKRCRSIDELLGTDIGAVFISTPGHLHAEHVEAALSAGKHVFAEKPVMTTRDGCRRVIELANAYPKQIVMIHHELRYSAYFQKIKTLIDSGEIGTPQLMWCKEFRGPFLKKVDDWIQDSRYSGGCLVDKNCHHFDLMNWWANSRPAQVCGFGGNDVVHVVNNQHEVIDHASVSFEYENGVRGSLMVCMFSPKLEADLEMGVVGDAGMLQTRMERDEILQWKRGSAENSPIVHALPARKAGWGAHHGFVEAHAAFFKAVESGTRPLTDVRECVDGTLLAIAAEESIAQGEVVKV